MKIASVDAHQIFDSRGNPTVEAEVRLEDGTLGRGLVPSGASTGQFEALELRDGNASRFRGKSVFTAIANIRGELAEAVIGREVEDQSGLDRALIQRDGAEGKRRLGANAVLGVSMAAADAAAKSKRIPLFAHLGNGTTLPLPEIQIFGGGAHAAWRTDIQDFLVIATGARDYPETLEMTFAVFHAAGELMKERGKLFGCADEGGFWPDFSTNEEAIATLCEVIERAGLAPGKDASVSLDIAASDLYDSSRGIYRLGLEGMEFSSEEFMDLLAGWCRTYPIVSIEDPAADADWSGWERFHEACGGHLQIVGDDLFTTNRERIDEGIRRGVANSVLIKLNQIGTVTEAIEAIRQTQTAGWSPVVSARSGETEDAFISHLAVATDAGQLKVGSFCRSERMAKWNECLRIGRMLDTRTRFAGRGALAPK